MSLTHGDRVRYNARTGQPHAYQGQHGQVGRVVAINTAHPHTPIDVQFEGVGFTLACHPDELTTVGEAG